MNPYAYVKEYSSDCNSLLSLGCGVGFEFDYIKLPKTKGIDIHDKYVEKVNQRHPDVETVVNNVVDQIQLEKDKSFDLISFLDVLEHLTKEEGLIVLEHCKRVASKRVLVFTQIGYLKNEPHDAWGVEGGDEYQKHKSGWLVEELESMGFKLIAKQDDISQHGEPYTAVMYLYEVPQ